jgi:hypothetical protein
MQHIHDVIQDIARSVANFTSKFRGEEHARKALPDISVGGGLYQYRILDDRLGWGYKLSETHSGLAGRA